MRDSDVLFAYSVIKPGVFRGGFDSKRDFLAGRTEMAAVLVSNCVNMRMKWISRVSKYIDVKVYGSCGPNSCSMQPTIPNVCPSFEGTSSISLLRTVFAVIMPTNPSIHERLQYSC